MELDSKDLMIDRLNSQIKQRALNTSITENDDLSVSGNTIYVHIQTLNCHAMSIPINVVESGV